MDCCSAGYDEVFTAKRAKRRRAEYARRGLGQPARQMVESAADRGLDDATVLEIGGGLGELHVELLRGGAATATNVELSRSWDAEAELLLAEHGLQKRVKRVIGDLVAEPALASEADIVVLNRVVCCYPDYVGLLGAAASRARRTLVFSYPMRNVAVRAGMSVINAWQRFKNRDYRAFAHRPSSMFEVLESAGLRPYAQARQGIWQVCALQRVDVLEPAS